VPRASAPWQPEHCSAKILPPSNGATGKPWLPSHAGAKASIPSVTAAIDLRYLPPQGPPWLLFSLIALCGSLSVLASEIRTSRLKRQVTARIADGSQPRCIHL